LARRAWPRGKVPLSRGRGERGGRKPAKLAVQPARGGAGMLRAALVVSAVFLAAGVAGSDSLANASVTRSDPNPITSEDRRRRRALRTVS
jgi:hypothetical protein